MSKCLLKAAAFCGMVAALLLTDGLSASAQRTVRGQMFSSANFAKTFTPATSNSLMGAELVVGSYLSTFYWSAGLVYFPGTGQVPVSSVYAEGGAMYRVIGTRNRMLNFYAGGNALFGVEYANGKKALQDLLVDDSGKIDVGSLEEDNKEYGTVLIYGVEPRVELEFFVIRKLAIVAGAGVPVTINTQADMITGRFYAGLRLNF